MSDSLTARSTLGKPPRRRADGLSAAAYAGAVERVMQRRDRRVEARRLITLRWPLPRIAAVLGVSVTTVRRDLREVYR